MCKASEKDSWGDNWGVRWAKDITGHSDYVLQILLPDGRVVDGLWAKVKDNGDGTESLVTDTRKKKNA